MQEEEVRVFLNRIEGRISPGVLRWIREFETKNHRAMDMYEFMRCPFRIGQVHFSGFPPSEDEIKDKNSSLSANILTDLRETYSDEEIKKLLALGIKEAINDKWVYRISMLFLIADFYENEEKIFNAFSEALNLGLYMRDGEIMFGLLRHQTKDTKRIVKLCNNLLRSPDYKKRVTGEGIMYCALFSIGSDQNLLEDTIDALITSYKYLLDPKTRAPFLNNWKKGDWAQECFLIGELLKEHPNLAEKHDKKLIKEIINADRTRNKKGLFGLLPQFKL